MKNLGLKKSVTTENLKNFNNSTDTTTTTTIKINYIIDYI